MVTFRQLAEARRKHVQDLVSPMTVPVLRVLDDGEPDYWCTGMVLRLGQESALISAAHALTQHTPALQLQSGAIAFVQGSVITSGELLGYSDPLADVACVRLTADETARLPHSCFVGSSTLAPFENRSPEAAYIVFGYRDKHQRFDHDTPMFYHKPSSILLGKFDGAAKVGDAASTEHTLLLGTSPAHFRGPDGSGGVPKFRGMSGSPVWRFNPQEDYSIQSLPPLIGIFLGEAPNTRKALLVLRVGVALALLERAFPDLAGYLPRFRAAS